MSSRSSRTRIRIRVRARARIRIQVRTQALAGIVSRILRVYCKVRRGICRLMWRVCRPLAGGVVGLRYMWSITTKGLLPCRYTLKMGWRLWNYVSTLLTDTIIAFANCAASAPIYPRPPARRQPSSQELRDPLTPSGRQSSWHEMRRQPSSQEKLDPFTPVRSMRQPSNQSLRDSRQPSYQSLRDSDSRISYAAPSPSGVVPTLAFPIPPGRRTLSSDKPEKPPIALDPGSGPSS